MRWQDDSCGPWDDLWKASQVHGEEPPLPLPTLTAHTLHSTNLPRQASAKTLSETSCKVRSDARRCYWRCKKKEELCDGQVGRKETAARYDWLGLTLHIPVMPQIEIWVCAATFVFLKLPFFSWNIYFHHPATKKQTSQPNLHGPSGHY